MKESGQRTQPDGWMVQAFLPVIGADEKMLLFFAAIPDRREAIAAVKEKLGALFVRGPFAIAPLSRKALGAIEDGHVHADGVDL